MVRSKLAINVLAASLALLFLGSPSIAVAPSDRIHGHADNDNDTINAAASPLANGQPAPQFRVRDLRGKSITLSSLRGKIVLLIFWASWCSHCPKEMDSLNQLYNRFKSESDFAMLAVSTGEDPLIVSNYVKKHKYDFPVALDPTGKVGDNYKVLGIPTAYVIDSQGRIVGAFRGEFDFSKFTRIH